MRTRMLIVVLLAALVLVGCADDPTPKLAQETQTTPTPTRTPSPIAVASPSNSQIPKPESAATFVQRWLDLSTQMQSSGEVAAYLAITSHCKPCNKLAKRVESYYQAGGYITFEGQRVVSTERIPSSPGITVLRVVVDAEPTDYQTSSSAPVQRFDGGRETVEVILIGSASSGWSLNNYLRVAQ